MADLINLFDNIADYIDKYNGLATEFNDVGSITSIDTDAGSIVIDSGQTNRKIQINGTTNISTSVDGSSVQVALDDTPSFLGFTSNGTNTLNGSTLIDTATIENLTVGIGPNEYDFPTASGAEGEALVFDAFGNLVAGLGGTGATVFTDLTDTPANYIGLGGRVLILDGVSGGDATAVTTDPTFTFDTTNNFLQVSKIRIGEGISPADTTNIKLLKNYTAIGSTPANTVNFDVTVNINTLGGSGSSSFNNSVSHIGSTETLNGLLNSWSCDTDSAVNLTFVTSPVAFRNEMNIGASDGNLDYQDAYGISNVVSMTGESTATEEVVGIYSSMLTSDNADIAIISGFKSDIKENSSVSNVTYAFHAKDNVGVDEWSYGLWSDAPVHIEKHLHMNLMTTNPSISPGSGYIYMKDTKFVIAYDDAGTDRYRTMELTGTGTTFTHSTIAP